MNYDDYNDKDEQREERKMLRNLYRETVSRNRDGNSKGRFKKKHPRRDKSAALQG